MTYRHTFGLLAVATFAISVQAAAVSSADHNWPQWRGPNVSGVAQDADPPIEWSESKNVKWKVSLPGNGLSTPIVWGDIVFIQSAIPSDKAKNSDADNGENEDVGNRGPGPRGDTPTSPYRFVLMALNRATGDTLWQKTLTEQVPHEGSHHDGSLAPASPVTDGEHVYAYFGSRGLYCLNMKGDIIWQKDLGRMQTRRGFGEGSSPALWKDTLIINWDHEGDSFVVALDKRTGDERWRDSRDEPTSWATPYVVAGDEGDQVVIPGANAVRSYDVKTGNLRWQCKGLGTNCIPSPVADSDRVYVMSGYRDPALLAIRLQGARGDLTGTDAVAWKLDGGTPYVPSPLVYGDTLYLLQRNNGILSCLDPQTGQPHYDKTRLDKIDGVYASLVGAHNRVYVLGRNGVAYVLKRGKEYDVLAINRLDDEFSASPAIVGNQLFLRGMKHLYCLAR